MDKHTCRSHNGYMVSMIMTLIQWLLKAQYTVETSVFGTEFDAMKQSIDTLHGIRYKLQIMGMDIDGPTKIHGDMSVINNSKPRCTLKKK